MGAISWQHAKADNDAVQPQAGVPLHKEGLSDYPLSTPRAPPGDLPVVLDTLCSPSFKPLAEAELWWLSAKTGHPFQNCGRASRQATRPVGQ